MRNLAGTANQWTVITGPNGDGSWPIGGSGEARQFLIIGRTTGAGSAPGLSGTNSTSEDLYIRSYEFTNVSTGTTLATVIENGTAGSTTNDAATDGTIRDSAVTTLGPDRLALNFIGINDDNAIAAMTGMTGGTWAEAVAEYAESSGTDASIGLQTAFPCSFSQEVSGATAWVRGTGGTTEAQAESFTTVGAITLSSIWLSLSKVAAPADDLVIELRTDSGSSPSSTVLESVTIPAASLTTTATWTKMAFTSSLSATTTYWIVARRTGARDTTNYFSLDTSAANLFSGVEKVLSSGSWADGGAIDFMLRIVSSVEAAGATIDGGTTTNADATDGWGTVGFALIGTTVAYDQTHYRFRNDDGDETTATWKAALDANP